MIYHLPYALPQINNSGDLLIHRVAEPDAEVHAIVRDDFQSLGYEEELGMAQHREQYSRNSERSQTDEHVSVWLKYETREVHIFK